MKNPAKLIVISVFGLCAIFLFLGSVDLTKFTPVVLAKVSPTPPANLPPANVPPGNTSPVGNANAVKPPAANTVAATGDKTIPKHFTLGKDSLSENGEAEFDHEAHAFKNYSPDGKSVMGCVECHHTDQPKSALKLPLSTSERDTTLTFDVWQKSAQKVSECRACHFQNDNVPDGKTMPSATYPDTGKTKVLDNQLAFHINCNTCHDEAFKLRPELKKKPGFATSKDCNVCHKINN